MADLRQWIPLAKEIVSWTAASCVGTTVGLASRTLIPPSSLPVGRRIEVTIGVMVLGSMAGALARNYVKGQLDEIFPDEVFGAQPQQGNNRNKQY